MAKSGGAASAFHSGCDGKGPTVTVVRSAETGSLFGGVSDVSWASSNKYARSNEAFLFCLDCAGEPNTPRQFAILPEQPEALLHHSEKGPTFGNGYDLSIASSPDTSTDSYANLGLYACPSHIGTSGSIACREYFAGSLGFKVADYSVYVIKIGTCY